MEKTNQFGPGQVIMVIPSASKAWGCAQTFFLIEKRDNNINTILLHCSLSKLIKHFVQIRRKCDSPVFYLCFQIQRGRSRMDQKLARNRKALIEPLTNRDIMLYIFSTTTHHYELYSNNSLGDALSSTDTFTRK